MREFSELAGFRTYICERALDYKSPRTMNECSEMKPQFCNVYAF